MVTYERLTVDPCVSRVTRGSLRWTVGLGSASFLTCQSSWHKALNPCDDGQVQFAYICTEY